MTHLQTFARRDALKRLATGAVGTAAVPGWVQPLFKGSVLDDAAA